MSKSNKSKISIEDSIIMGRVDFGIRNLSEQDYNRYLELKAIKDQWERKKMYDSLVKLIPDKEQELKSYFYPSFKTTKNNKFGIIKGVKFKSKGIIHKIRSWGKTFIRSTENEVFKNEDIDTVIIS